MTFDQLRYFVLASVHENLARAAEESFMSVSGISKALARLEEEVGVALFQRNANTLRLNEAGKRFEQFARHVLDEQTATMSDIQALCGTQSNQLRIALPADHMLEEPLLKTLAQHPNLELTQTIKTTDEAQQALEHLHVDLAVTCHPLENSDLQCDKLFEDRLCAAVGINDPLLEEYDKDVPFEVLQHRILILPVFKSELSAYIMKQYLLLGCQPHICQCGGNTRFSLIRRNLGFFFMRESESEMTLQNESGIRLLRVTNPEFITSLYLSFRKNQVFNLPTKDFMNNVVEFYLQTSASTGLIHL